MRSGTERRATVGIVGGGPAGSSLAIRLARLGHGVVIVTDGRTRYGLQGVSRRTLEALIELRASEALHIVGSPVPRLVLWNGAEASPNDESLVDRRDFDRTLLRDAVNAGAECIVATVRQTPGSSGRLKAVRRDGKALDVAATLWVDARGRSVLRATAIEAAGPPTVAVQQHFRSAIGGARSGIASVQDGWCWVGVREDGYGIVQYTTNRKRGALAGIGSTDLPATLVDRHPALRRLLSRTHPTGAVRAYPAGLALVDAETCFHAGDARLAPDPLSGHGLYEALAGSLHMAAAVNTVLRTPNNATLAHRFVRERARERYAVLATMSARVHREETRWSTQPFWAERREAPQTTPTAPSATSIVRGAAVLDNDRIVAADVVVTPDCPRGVWRVHDVPVVDLLRRLRGGQSLEAAAGALGVPLDRSTQAAHWLERQGLGRNASP